MSLRTPVMDGPTLRRTHAVIMVAYANNGLFDEFALFNVLPLVLNALFSTKPSPLPAPLGSSLSTVYWARDMTLGDLIAVQQ